MKALMVRMRAWPPILVVPLLILVIFTLESPTSAAAEANNGANFRLKGVLISPSGGSALINNRVLREGEELDGVEILEIREGEIVVRRGSQQLTVWVGTRAAWHLARPYKAPAPAVAPALDVAPAAAPLTAQVHAATSYGPVQRGETLSEIAEQHLVGDLTINQMMVALYEENPDAFQGNINLLREGAVLQLPQQDVLHNQAVATATAEVLRQTRAWREQLEQWLQPTTPAGRDKYGPVTRGQTLSGIAASLSRDGTTMNQMMVALFDANPNAFGGNINVLREGAVLEIPDEAALLRLSHETATATIMDHMDAWRHGTTQQLQSAVTDDVPATPDDSMQADDTILLSMQGIR